MPAELVVRQRVSTLAKALPGAAQGDPVAVHQARVATRRLREALALTRGLAIDMADLHNLKVVGAGTSGPIRLIGELDVMNVDAVGRHLEEELRTGNRLTLDLSRVTFIDSKGLAMLLQLSELANELDLIPIVLKTSEVVRRVMEVGLPAPIPGVEIER